MELKEIYRIVDRYYNGETTLEEEVLLREYFSQNEVPEDLKSAQLQILYFEHGHEEEVYISVSHPGKKKELYLRIMSAAAGLALMFMIGSQIFQSKPNSQVAMHITVLDTPEEEAQALKETQKALSLISEKLNSGTKKMEDLSKAGKINEVFKLKK